MQRRELERAIKCDGVVARHKAANLRHSDVREASQKFSGRIAVTSQGHHHRWMLMLTFAAACCLLFMPKGVRSLGAKAS